MKFLIVVFLLVCLHHVFSQDSVQLSRLRLPKSFTIRPWVTFKPHETIRPVTLFPPTTPRIITPFPILEPFTIPTPRVRIPSLATGRPWESIRDHIIHTGVIDGPRK